MPAAAQSAAVLGSRNARRQLRSVLAAAAEAGAYSVGFTVVRGGLTGFSVYLAGDFAGAHKGSTGTAASTCAVPPHAPTTATSVHTLPSMGAPAATAAPAMQAARRKRGCRAGAKEQRRRHDAREHKPNQAHRAAEAVPLEGDATAPPPLCKDAHFVQRKPAAPHAPPLHINPISQPPSSLSPFAPDFVLPLSPSLSSPSNEVAPRVAELTLTHDFQISGRC